MSKTPVDEELVLTYHVTEQLAIHLIEICSWRPDFPQCPYCGASEYWNVVWPTGFALARYLATAVPAERFRRRRVLVLGCGVGLESIVLAKLGARVSALDHVPEALQLVERNCALNGLNPVPTICWCWRDRNRCPPLGPYDVLIGGDVLYEPEDGAWIHAVLTTALKPDGWALLADPLRAGVDEFFRGLEVSGFRVQVQPTQTPWLSGQEEVKIYQVQRTETNRTHI